MTQTSSVEAGLDAALAVLRTMVGIADTSVEKLTADLTLTQFRALRRIVEHTPVTMRAVAQELNLNPSSVTRACYRLESLALLQRAQNPLNRREVLLAPTARGRQVVERVGQDRRTALAEILGRLDPGGRADVVAAFERFAAAAATVLPDVSGG